MQLVVYDLIGQKVTTLVNGIRQAGVFAVEWDGRDENGDELASGVYLYRLTAALNAPLRLETDDRVTTRKLLLLR